MSFNWQSWNETQAEADASAHRAESEARCPGEIWLDEFMAQAKEINDEMQQLLQEK